MASRAGRQVVLVVDDDHHMRFLARRALERAGYAVQEAASAAQADREVRQEPPHLVILDLMLPGTSGAQLLQRWRQDRIDLPVIMLTAHGHAEREAALLEAGADDYLDKPFEARVLTARVANVLRRVGTAVVLGDVLEVGPLCLRVRERVVIVGERRVPLTRTETALLRELMRVPGMVRSYEELLTQVWGASYVGQTEILHTNVYRLRRKLEDDAAHPRYLVATPAVGYCLLPEVRPDR